LGGHWPLSSSRFFIAGLRCVVKVYTPDPSPSLGIGGESRFDSLGALSKLALLFPTHTT